MGSVLSGVQIGSSMMQDRGPAAFSVFGIDGCSVRASVMVRAVHALVSELSSLVQGCTGIDSQIDRIWMSCCSGRGATRLMEYVMSCRVQESGPAMGLVCGLLQLANARYSRVRGSWCFGGFGAIS